MDAKELTEIAFEIDKNTDESSVCFADIDIIKTLLKNCEITFNDNSVFFGDCNCENTTRQIMRNRLRKHSAGVLTEENRKAISSLAYTGDPDFGHTAPLWDDIISLGLPGLRSRAEKMTENKRYREGLVSLYDAACEFLKRIAMEAESQGKTLIAAGLYALSEKAPSSLYEAMQLVIIYYTLQHNIEGTNLRTLGRIDRMFAPFVKNESDETVKTAIKDFILEIDRLRAPANIPFMLGGADENENDLISPLSELILKTYISLKPANTKLHILCTDNTPKELMRAAFEGIKKGSNSIVFMNDRMVRKALVKLGESSYDAREYSVVGCYECGGREETACTCNARVNIPKALELALHNGCDGLTGEKIGLSLNSEPDTYEILYEAFRSELDYLVSQAITITDKYEKLYPFVHSSPFFSSTYPSCLIAGNDVYCGYTAKYNNSSLVAIGLATAVDSLAAIKKAVYDDKKYTIREIVKILDSNWADNEILRRTIINKYPKYGNGIKEIDAIAAGIVNDLSDMVNNRPNVKGGVYRLGLFSIDWRVDFGRHTAASADGRMNGEPLSQNTGAVFGADRYGVTAHILSVTSIDTSNTADGAILDLDLHSSAVQGDNGTAMMVSTLETYFKRGGFAVHYNVLDTGVLHDAKAHPEKYPNLQVRLCGWNVKFTELSPEAQDEFIRRSEYTEK